MLAARAVVFDVGGVLERPVAPAFAGRWERRLDLAQGELAARLRRSGLGRAANLGRVSEAEFARALGELYGLDEAATGELLGDLWDWYVGEPNTELVGYLRGLRARCRTAILLDDLEANVSGARAVGMSAVLFEDTAQATADVEAWLSAGGATPSGDAARAGCCVVGRVRRGLRPEGRRWDRPPSAGQATGFRRAIRRRMP